MKNIFRAFAIGLALSASAALAAVGTPPLSRGSFSTIDQSWLSALAGGQNQAFVSGVAAAGTTQATATALTGGIALVEIDSGTGGFNLPACLAGTGLWVYNKSGATLTAYPAVANNPVTGSQDTINGSTSKGSFTDATATFYGCAKNGAWFAK